MYREKRSEGLNQSIPAWQRVGKSTLKSIEHFLFADVLKLTPSTVYLSALEQSEQGGGARGGGWWWWLGGGVV